MKQTADCRMKETHGSNALEKERGITIYAKNTSITYKGMKINIVDIPVTRISARKWSEFYARWICAFWWMLKVQCRRLGLSLKISVLGLKPIVVINKIDKPASEPDRVHNEVLELFLNWAQMKSRRILKQFL